jgi:hypothetical protein
VDHEERSYRPDELYDLVLEFTGNTRKRQRMYDQNLPPPVCTPCQSSGNSFPSCPGASTKETEKSQSANGTNSSRQ